MAMIVRTLICILISFLASTSFAAQALQLYQISGPSYGPFDIVDNVGNLDLFIFIVLPLGALVDFSADSSESILIRRITLFVSAVLLAVTLGETVFPNLFWIFNSADLFDLPAAYLAGGLAVMVSMLLGFKREYFFARVLAFVAIPVCLGFLMFYVGTLVILS